MPLNPFESIDMPFAVETVYNDPAAIWGDDVARRPGRGKDQQADASAGDKPVITPERQIFSANLRMARITAGLTQADLAERSGLRQSHISELESGEVEPRLQTIMALADALKLEPSLLIPTLDRRMPDLK